MFSRAFKNAYIMGFLRRWQTGFVRTTQKNNKVNKVLNRGCVKHMQAVLRFHAWRTLALLTSPLKKCLALKMEHVANFLPQCVWALRGRTWFVAARNYLQMQEKYDVVSWRCQQCPSLNVPFWDEFEGKTTVCAMHKIFSDYNINE